MHLEVVGRSGHMSHVTCHMSLSHVTGHMSHVTCHPIDQLIQHLVYDELVLPLAQVDILAPAGWLLHLCFK